MWRWWDFQKAEQEASHWGSLGLRSCMLSQQLVHCRSIYRQCRVCGFRGVGLSVSLQTITGSKFIGFKMSSKIRETSSLRWGLLFPKAHMLNWGSPEEDSWMTLIQEACDAKGASGLSCCIKCIVTSFVLRRLELDLGPKMWKNILNKYEFWTPSRSKWLGRSKYWKTTHSEDPGTLKYCISTNFKDLWT